MMEETKAKKFEEATAAFPLGFKQDVIAYLTTLKDHGFTIDDIKDFHKYKLLESRRVEKEIENEIIKKRAAIRCPECPGLMLLLPVNDRPETQTGNPKDRSVWMCQNNECGETIYNEQTAEEIIKSGGT